MGPAGQHDDHEPAGGCVLVANKAKGILGRSTGAVLLRLREALLPLYSALLTPHLEYSLRFSDPYFNEGQGTA